MIIPTKDQVLKYLTDYPNVAYGYVRLHGSKSFAQSEKTGQSIERFECYGALFDIQGNRLSAEWIEQSKATNKQLLIMAAVFSIIAIGLFIWSK